jgi:hypothetical protein
MLKNQSLIALLVLGLVMSFSLVSCEWEEYKVSDIPIEEVSFSNDIMPIFNQSCNSVGCHNAGGIPPDLSPANGWQDLYDTDMIDLDNPANSELYVRMIDNASPMPLNGVLSPTVTNTVLVWIEEGAKDN